MRLRGSLRGKLAIAMAMAALLPLVLASGIAIRVALWRLDRGTVARARQTAGIAVNLLMREVQRISTETRTLAASAELQELLTLQPLLVPRFLETYRSSVDSVLVEVANTKGRVVGRRSPAGQRFKALKATRATAALAKALQYEHHITITRVAGQVAIQAAAPVVDGQFLLRGAVVATVPLDQQMADYIKGVLRAEVGFLDGVKPLASTFFKHDGERLKGVDPPADLAARVMRGSVEQMVGPVEGREYQLVFSRLQTVDGAPVGMMLVGLDRTALVWAQASAVRSLALGAAAALVFAFGLALVLGRRITTPISRLQRSTQAIAAGDLGQELAVETDDEIGELARSFLAMTDALRRSREGLDDRIRELSTLHRISQAVTSVIGLDDVLRLVVDQLVEALGVQKAALLLADQEGVLKIGAQGGLEAGSSTVSERDLAVATRAIEGHTYVLEGPVLAVLLETHDRVIGALVVERGGEKAALSEAAVNLVVTFAGQAATAIDNARLYQEVTEFSEQLEGQVRARTAELQTANEELGHALEELKETQAQLIHSERMAGLGNLIAGVAHEINTPAGAIQGNAQVLGETLDRAMSRMCALMECDLEPGTVRRLLEARTALERGKESGARPRPPAEVRRLARELGQTLEARGIENAGRLARQLVEAEVEALADRLVELAPRVDLELVVGLLADLCYLERGARSIQSSIATVVRIVRALRGYAHTDQEAVREIDLLDGIETTLTILQNQLRYDIQVVRKYAMLPKVPVYVDELNQVWTNLIHNAVQAMEGRGELAIETFQEGQEVGVRVTDSGPGIRADVMPQIFEPFFSTKGRGEGMGLGLGIARKIIAKHGGQIAVESRPGSTTFTVVLPVSGPPAALLPPDEMDEDGR